MRLAQLQGTRINGALAQVGPEAGAIVARYLSGLIDPSERKKVQDALAGPR